MTGTEVVGPVPNRVTFTGGTHYRTPRALLPAVVYSVPRNTLDPRYAVCRNHHVACDCREAELAEQLHDLRLEFRHLQTAIDTVLAGHPTDTTEDHTGCMCTGCQIARRTNFYPTTGADQ